MKEGNFKRGGEFMKTMDINVFYQELQESSGIESIQTITLKIIL